MPTNSVGIYRKTIMNTPEQLNQQVEIAEGNRDAENDRLIHAGFNRAEREAALKPMADAVTKASIAYMAAKAL